MSESKVSYYFDLSTSARWSGRAVGIVRVERELGRRLRSHLAQAGGYCIYDRVENAVRVLPDSVAHDVIAGRVAIDFNVHRSDAALSASDLSWRRRARDLILSKPRLYQLVQLLRGRSFSLEQIADIRRAEAVARESPSRNSQIMLSMNEAAPDRLSLGQEIVIISSGLDWEYKDIRALYRMKAASEFKYAAVIYDLIPILYPHFVVPSYVTLLREYFGELFWLSDYCMAISQKTKSDLIEYCEDWGIPRPHVDHFPLGGDLPSDPTEKVALPPSLIGKRYAIFVSTIEPRKNHRTVYQAWDCAIRSGAVDPETCRLVFVGMEGWNTGDLRSEMAANPRTRDTIVTLSGVSDAELRLLYQSAEFSLFPSHYEGYGLPVAEALSYGVPCICSDAGSLPEIAGDLVQYCDPTDPKAWERAIVEAFSNPDDLQRRAARVRREFKAPTWDDAADTFFGRLRALVEDSSR